MLLRDVLGRATFVQLSGVFSETQIRSGATVGTPWPVRHAHDISIPLVEVRRPPVAERLEVM
jgi:hypothetical protein